MLRQAYAAPSGVVRWRGVDYVAGTKSPADVMADIAAFVGVDPSYRRKRLPFARRVVGHSLGGLIAARSGLPSKAYGPYALPWLPHADEEDSNTFDPVAVFSRTHHRGYGHSLTSYEMFSPYIL